MSNIGAKRINSITIVYRFKIPIFLYTSRNPKTFLSCLIFESSE